MPRRYVIRSKEEKCLSLDDKFGILPLIGNQFTPQGSDFDSNQSLVFVKKKTIKLTAGGRKSFS